MEIHPPEGRVESVKDFLVHLSMITIGILIALGLEQAVESWHHHEVAVEARENILKEIRDNKQEVEGQQAALKTNMQQLRHTLETVRQLLAHKKLSEMEMSINVSGADLSATSWTTASTTGAFAYMGYGEAKKFAKAYDIQAILQRAQEDEFRTASGAMTLISYGASTPAALTEDQLRTVERNTLDCMAMLALWDQVAAQLVEEYKKVLATA